MCECIMKLFFDLLKCSACVYLLSSEAFYSAESNVVFGDICRLAATKSVLYLNSTLPGIAGFHSKIAASSVLYAKEKNIYYDPDYLSGLSRALLPCFSDNVSRNSCMCLHTSSHFH